MYSFKVIVKKKSKKITCKLFLVCLGIIYVPFKRVETTRSNESFIPCYINDWKKDYNISKIIYKKDKHVSRT